MIVTRHRGWLITRATGLSLFHARVTGLSLGFGLGLGASACVLPNPDHCQNRALDPHAWCAYYYEQRPYCSPCAAENNGCVGEEPSEVECPAYSSPATETGAETETGTEETDTDTNTETGTEETG